MIIIKSDISLFVYDFDGVMTNNKVYIDQHGNEIVQVSRADGLGVSEINNLGIKQIIISTEKNQVVTARATKLGIECLQGIDNKEKALINYCKEKDISLKNVAYVGNDINDEDVMKIVGLTFCPSDSHISIKKISNYILESKGGDGIVREIIDLIKNKKEF